MSELKPCPFCGGYVGLSSYTEITNDRTAIGTFKCWDCLAEIRLVSGYRDYPIAALYKKWNGRAEDA